MAVTRRVVQTLAAALLCAALPACSPEATPSGSVGAQGSPLSDAETKALRPDDTRFLYIPVYSHINTGNGSAAYNLAVTLAVRNTDAQRPLILTSIDYHNTVGKRVNRWLERPIRLGPLAAYEVFVREDDTTGGVGASFRVGWNADAGVSPPLAEAVHAGTLGGQGVSFITRGIEGQAGPKQEPAR